MALIGKIRNNMWFVFVLIALATGAFILMDAMGPGGGGGGNPNSPIGVIGDTKIKQMDFEKSYQILFANAQNPHASRNQLWNYFVENALLEGIADKIGMAVGVEELKDLQFGQNLSPIIYQNFINPQTGQLDVNQLGQIRQAIETKNFTNPALRQFWAEQERQIIKTQLEGKVSSLVAKSLYTPNWLAEATHQEENGTATLALVKIPFDKIPAGDVSVSDADITNYIKAREHEFLTKEEKRIGEYVSLSVRASAADTAFWLNKIENAVTGFGTAANDSAFAVANGGFYQTYYATKDEIDEFYKDKLDDYAIGGVYGPYQLYNSFQAVKLVDKRIVPDSVSAAHILRRVTPGNTLEKTEANRVIDSLYDVLSKNRSLFDTLAVDFSQDFSNSATGGDLGTFAQGMMVREFNDACFLNGTKGGLYKVETQFGIHLLYVKDQIFKTRETKFKIAYINTPIIPTKETENTAYQKMLELISSYPYLDGLRKAINDDPALTIRETPMLGINDYQIRGMQEGNTPRAIVKWLFDKKTDLNKVSPTVHSFNDPISFFTNEYIIVGLSKIIKPGLPAASDLRNSLEFTVLNQLKAEKAIKNMSSNDLNALASQFNVTIDTFNNINLLNTFVAGIGNEPAVIGAGFSGAPGSTSAPILGNSGVFVVKTLSKNDPGSPSNISFFKQSVSNRSRNTISQNLMESLRNSSKIKDNRASFY